MRYVAMSLVAAIGLGLVAGCAPQSIADARDAATYLDGRTVSDKEGCVYTVTQYGSRGNATVLLRVVPELSADTCKFKVGS